MEKNTKILLVIIAIVVFFYIRKKNKMKYPGGVIINPTSSESGNDSGYEEGYQNGYDDGNNDGYDEGYDDGNNDGYDEGFGTYPGNQSPDVNNAVKSYLSIPSSRSGSGIQNKVRRGGTSTGTIQNKRRR